VDARTILNVVLKWKVPGPRIESSRVLPSVDGHFLELTHNWPLSELVELDADFSPPSPEFNLKVVRVGYFTMLSRLRSVG
jgi:hypothetical protein